MTANMHEREKYCLSARLLDTQVKAERKEGRKEGAHGDRSQ
jgi:hypothetical protein